MRRLAICGAVLLLTAGCGVSQPARQAHPAQKTQRTASKTAGPKLATNTGTASASVLPRTWTIGKFRVEELPLPADFFKKAGGEVVVGTYLLTFGAEAPYPVTWRSLTSGKTGTVTQDGCPGTTSFAYVDLNSSYPPGDAALVCEGTTTSTLRVIHTPDMTVSTYLLPGRPKTASEYLVGAFAFGWPTDPQILWSVAQSEGPAPLIGSGIMDLKTGKNAPWPKGFNTELRVAPDGTLYGLNGNTLSRWGGTSFEVLGRIPGLRVQAVGDDGVVWVDQPSPSDVWTDTLIRETVGSDKTQSWTIHGGNRLFGPGFIAWTPGTSLTGPPLSILFAEAHRTLTLWDVWGQPYLSGFGGANYEIITHTREGPAVIEILPPS